MATLEQLLAIQNGNESPSAGAASIDALIKLQQELDGGGENQSSGSLTRARGRSAEGLRKERVRLTNEAKQAEARELLSGIDAGEVEVSSLDDEQVQSVQKARIDRIPEISEIGLSGLSENAGFLQAMAGITTFNDDEFGKILKAADPAIGIVSTPEGERIAVNNDTGVAVSLNKIGPSIIDAMRFGATAAAFTPAGRFAVSAPAVGANLIGREVASQTGIRALAGSVGAGLTEASLQALQEAAGGDFDKDEIALAATLGGAAELAVPAAKELLKKARKIRNFGTETAEQASRRAAFEAEGLSPTRAQVTRDAGEFQAQQEASKTSGPIRSRLEQQEARLQGAFEQKAIDTNGEIITSTSTPIDEVLDRSIALDKEVGRLYQQAREAAPTGKDIRLSKLAQSLNSLAGEENISGGLISSIRSNLLNRGIIDKKGKVIGRVSVDTGEQIRQDINSLFDSVSDRGRQLSRQLKDSLDEDVLKQSGTDLFDTARSAKRNFEQGLNRAQISKFDKRKSNLVRDMLDNKVNPDTFVGDVVFAKKWRREDVNQLKNYLNQTDSGKQAWNDLRAQTMDEIRNRAFKGPVREDGITQSLSRDGLQKALTNLKGKSDVIFTTEELDFLKRMENVARLREPSAGTFSGKGPSAQAIREVKNRLPIVGGLLDSLSEFRQNKLLLKLPKKARPTRRVRQSRPTARPAQAAQQLRATGDNE
jgi:hypothetical protein